MAKRSAVTVHALAGFEYRPHAHVFADGRVALWGTSETRYFYDGPYHVAQRRPRITMFEQGVLTPVALPDDLWCERACVVGDSTRLALLGWEREFRMDPEYTPLEGQALLFAQLDAAPQAMRIAPWKHATELLQGVLVDGRPEAYVVLAAAKGNAVRGTALATLSWKTAAPEVMKAGALRQVLEGLDHPSLGATHYNMGSIDSLAIVDGRTFMHLGERFRDGRMDWSSVSELDAHAGRRFVSAVSPCTGRFVAQGRALALHDRKKKKCFVHGLDGSLLAEVPLSGTALKGFEIVGGDATYIYLATSTGLAVVELPEPLGDRLRPLPPALAPLPAACRVFGALPAEVVLTSSPEPTTRVVGEGGVTVLDVQAVLFEGVVGWGLGEHPHVAAPRITHAVLKRGIVDFFETRGEHLALAFNFLLGAIESVTATAPRGDEKAPAPRGAKRVEVRTPSGLTVLLARAAFADALAAAVSAAQP